MTDKHDFSAALESLDACRYWYEDKLGVERTEAIQTALRIADRLQRGDVSEEMQRAAYSVDPKVRTNIFKAMAKQMIEEEATMCT